MSNITELVPGRKYMVSPTLYKPEYHGMTLLFLGIDNTKDRIPDYDDFDEEMNDCYWFYNLWTESEEHWFIPKEIDCYDFYFSKEVDYLFDV